MQTALEQKTPGRGSSLASVVGVSFLCMGVLAGNTFAQSAPSKPEPKSIFEEKAKAAPKTEPATSAKSKPALEAKLRSIPKDAANTKTRATPQPKRQLKTRGPTKVDKRRRRASFTMNPDAKWACDQQTVTLPPVWRGNQQLTFGFDIRNQGTADLKIRARGG